MKSFFIHLICLLGTSVLLAQNVNYTAKDIVPPYEGLFHPGSNLGYSPPWTTMQLADIAAGNPAVGTMGIGAKSCRPGIFGSIVEVYGYDISSADYDHFASLGMNELTCIVGFPPEWHQDLTNYCPTNNIPSAMYRNLYLPIWDNGENGTPVNDDNFYALYLYKIVQLYGDHVAFWEIWNEPGFDYSNKGWRAPGDPFGNWWDENPDPCDYILRAPIFHYIRTLRISWEIIKTYDPDAYVTVAGVGYESFLDAICRNTDNPVDGSVTPEYPHGGGAYFDCMGFHSYPHFDGSTKMWDPTTNSFIFTRHSDGAADGIPFKKQNRQSVLSNYGFDGITYPEKEWIITEINTPRQNFGDHLGSQESQINFIMKAVPTCMQNGINQMHVYNLGDRTYEFQATNAFDILGLYQKLEGTQAYTQVMNPEGLAYKTTSDMLYGTRYDAARTNAMNLPDGIRGGAFKNDATGLYTYMLWAKTTIDQSEFAQGNYSFPAAFGLDQMTKYEWNYAQFNNTSTISSQGINLDARPIFLRAVGDEPPVFTADLSLSMASSANIVTQGQQIVLTLTVTNSGPDAADNVTVNYSVPGSFTFNSADPAYNQVAGTWNVGTIGSGLSATININLTAGTLASPVTHFAQIQTASVGDPDSVPGNDNNNTANEDDEAGVSIAPEGQTICAINNVAVTTTCNDNGTTDTGDDYYTLTLLPTGNDLGASYNVSGGLTANNVAYGSAQQIGGAIAIGTSYNLVITDISGTCSYNVSVASPAPCSGQTGVGVDLSLELSASPGDPAIYTSTTFTLTVTNSGSEAADEVAISFPIPGGILAYVSDNVTQGSYDNWNGIWKAETIAPGTSQTLTLQLFTLTGDEIPVYVQVVSATGTDVDSSPNNNPGPVPQEDDEAVFTLNGDNPDTGTGDDIDLELNMSVDDATFNAWENVVYSIALKNNGDVTATGISLKFDGLESLAYVDEMASHGNYLSWLGEWNISALAAGETATLQLTLFTLKGQGSITFFGQVTGANENDADSTPGNNSGVVPQEDDEAAVTIYAAAQLRNTETEIENGLVKKYHIYPNPATDVMNLSFESEENGDALIEVYDIRGAKVIARSTSVLSGRNDLRFDITDLQAGMYHMLVFGAKGEVQKLRFVKQRL